MNTHFHLARKENKVIVRVIQVPAKISDPAVVAFKKEYKAILFSQENLLCLFDVRLLSFSWSSITFATNLAFFFAEIKSVSETHVKKAAIVMTDKKVAGIINNLMKLDPGTVPFIITDNMLEAKNFLSEK
jgi:hypothetical protein